MVVALFPEPGERARAMGVYAFVGAAGAAIGTLLGRLRRHAPADTPLGSELEQVRGIAQQALERIRHRSQWLHPGVLDDFGLVPALERLTDSVAEQSAIRVDFHSALGEMRLPAEVETTLYRVVQESLTNVVKHASADHVSITLVRKGPAAVVVVEDDGTGFDPAGLRDGALGIAGMRERVALVGGRLTIESSPSRGTTLVAEVPATADAGERRR